MPLFKPHINAIQTTGYQESSHCTVVGCPIYPLIRMYYEIYAEMLYLSPEATNAKNKGTFFSSTFKVEEKKVPLFFELVASGLRYGRFLIFFFGIFRHFLKLPLYKCLYFYLKIGKFLKRT